MSLKKKTLKELQQLCRDARLKVAGNKNALIERLEFRSASNTLLSEEADSGSENDQVSSEPQTSNFQPTYDDIMMILPEFDPTSADSMSSKQFVQRVQTLKNVYNWRDDVLVFAVQQKLHGHAKYWIDSHQEVFVSWARFAEKIVESFPFNDNAADAHVKMGRTKREYGESPQDFYYRMLALGTKHGIAENAIARYVVNNINEEHLKRKISNEYFSCAELLRDIESYCRFNYVGNAEQKTKMGTSSVDNKRGTKPRGDSERETYHGNANKDRGMQNRVRCYNCSKLGHIAANCPLPQKSQLCSKCNKYHSRSVACAANKPTVNVHKIEEKTVQEPELMKQVSGDGWSGQALVDPGSDKTLIRKSLFDITPGPVKKCLITLTGFGGSQYVCEQQKQLNMMIDGIQHTATVLQVNDGSLETDILLGRDVLCQSNTRLIIENEHCWIEEVQTATATVEQHSREDLEQILTDHRDCFAESASELGTCTVKQMVINLTTDVPVCVKPYRIAFAKREEARKIIEELLQANIIEPSQSPYASPVVLVPKPDGSLRLCVDYRLLNKVTVKVPFPMPIMEEQFAQLAGNRYFTTMDLRMGYHQVQLEEKSRKYTAFVTMDGHYQYTRMPFGLVNAPAVFQDIMNIVAAKMKPGEVLAYLDDVVIPSKTPSEGLARLQKFLQILRQAGLTLRLDKCRFLATEIMYLGHTISAEGVKPGDRKVNAIQNFSSPTSITDVRRFLGLTGFFRKFIPNYAVISNPLTKMLHKANANKFDWGEPQETSFAKLVQLLCEKPVLALFDFTAHHEVHTDASSLGLAGVLLQSHNMKDWQAVFYYSRHCTDAEQRYHAYELEVLAAVETLNRFRVYVLGKPFRLITDCSAIARVKAQKELVPKIARWYLRLMEFDFEAVHRSGNRMSHVDALSRAPNEPSCEVETAGFIHRVTVDQDDWLYTMQIQDNRLNHIMKVLRGEVKDEQAVQLKKEYQLKRSRLYRKDNGYKFVVPKNVRWRVVKACHDDVGHFGVEKTIARIQQTFWFPKIRKYVKEYIAACINCCYSKTQVGRREGRMYVAETNPTPFATLHLDHLGPFIKSARGMSYVLAISDAFSKFLIVKAVRSTKTGPVISALLEITSYFGLPKVIITDRGTAYTSKPFKDFCDANKVYHSKNAVRTPRANGQVERANQIILGCLRTNDGRAKDWDLQLRSIQWAVNSQKNNTTGYSPNELVFDFTLRDLTHNKMIAVINDEEDGVDEQPITEKRLKAVENIQREREKWKVRFDKCHTRPTEYSVDDLVLVAYEPPATGESRKLEAKFKGPYLIAKVLGHDRYLVTDIPGLQMTQKPFESVFASDKLRKWCYSAPELDGENEDDGADEDDDGRLEDDSMSGTAELSADTVSPTTPTPMRVQ